MMEMMIDLETIVLLYLMSLAKKEEKTHVNTTIFQWTSVKTTYMKEGHVSCVKYGHS